MVMPKKRLMAGIETDDVAPGGVLLFARLLGQPGRRRSGVLPFAQPATLRLVAPRYRFCLKAEAEAASLGCCGTALLTRRNPGRIAVDAAAPAEIEVIVK